MICSVFTPVLWLALAAGVTTDSIPAPVASLHGAETALVAAVAKQGMRDALDPRMSPLAMLFQPYPTMGPPWIKDHVVPDARWTPDLVEVSGVGDLGYTVGPWHATGADSTPRLDGYFLSFWRYHPRTDWKLMLHITGGALPSSPSVPATPIAGSPFQWNMGPVPVIASHDTLSARRNALGGADAALGAEVARQGWRAAYAAVTAPDARRYGPGAPPAVGQAAVLDQLATETGAVAWDQVGTWLAQSVDLGYTYGKCVRDPGTPNGTKTEWAYVHVWRMDRKGARRLALEFLAPIQRK